MFAPIRREKSTRWPTALALTFHLLLLLGPLRSNGQPQQRRLVCYQCSSSLGIETPECLHPVSREAFTLPCYEDPPSQLLLCMKFVYFKTASLDGQIYKNWVMERACISSDFQQLLVGRLAVCGECVRVAGSLKFFPRSQLTRAKIPHPAPPDAPEEVVFANRSFCFCCKDKCNGEEGFELARLRQQEEDNVTMAAVGASGGCWFSLKAPRHFWLVFLLTVFLHLITIIMMIVSIKDASFDALTA